MPLETTHAHNNFIHNWVELGVLGLLGVVGLFLAPVVVGGWRLFQKMGQDMNLQKVLLIGLLALLAGRFVEQSVGVAKVSDLIVFWVLLAVMVNVPNLTSAKPSGEVAKEPLQLQPRRSRHRRAAAGAFASGSAVVNVAAYWKWGLIALLIGGIITLTWVKNFTYVQALGQVAGLNQAFVRQDLGTGLAMVERATELAPDVYHYRSAAGAIWSAYRVQRGAVKEPECNLQSTDSRSYDVCLAEKVYSSYSAEVERNPWRWRSRIDLADAAAELASLTRNGDLAEEALRRYRETTRMAPYSWKLQNQLAKTYISSGKPEAGLEVIAQSLGITGDTKNSSEAFLLTGLAYGQLNQLPAALAAYDEAIRLDPGYVLAYNNRGIVYGRQGEYQLAIADYDQAISIDPEHAEAWDNRGNAYSRLARFAEAIASYDAAIRLLPSNARAYNNRGNTHALLGKHAEAIADFDQAIQLNPNYALAYASRALAYARANMPDQARQDVERAVALGADRESLENGISKLQTQADNVRPGQ
ncbi:MAG: tetratricopeptide repeat protein [Chloroflexi bacterium]|nr:tetratricopeptide repeat protein [Chloroflexota bacterium]